MTIDTITLLQIEQGARVYGVVFPDLFSKQGGRNTYFYKSMEALPSGTLAVVKTYNDECYKLVQVVKDVTEEFEPKEGYRYNWLLHTVDPAELSDGDTLDAAARKRLRLAGAIEEAKRVAANLPSDTALLPQQSVEDAEVVEDE